MPGIPFSAGFALMPVAGVGFLFRDLMSGSVATGPAILAVAATAFYAALALVFAARAFGREEVLFGTGSSGASGKATSGWFLRPGRAWTGVPTPGAAVGLVAVVGLLFFYGARPLVMARGETGIFISQWVFLALPAVLLLAAGRYDMKATLSLRWPSAASLGAALLIILGGIPIGWLIVWLQSFVLALPYELLESMQQMIAAADARRIAWLLLMLAITPAICEEVVFRGVLLRSLASSVSAGRSIALSALVFGAFHLSFESAIRLLPTAWLGLLLGFVVWRTRSILPGILMHAVNNGLVVLLVAVPALGRHFATAAGNQPPWLSVALAPLLLYAGYRLLPERPEPPQP
jgi:sodium transport system permease protein